MPEAIVRRLLILSYHFPPSNAVGARRPARLARLLPEHGFEVEVLGGSPVHRPLLRRHSPTWSPAEAEDCGSPVLRVPTPYIFGRNPAILPEEGLSLSRAWWKARAYTEFLLLTRDWQWRWGLNALRSLERTRDLRRYDLVLVSMPPAFAVIPVLRRFRELGIPVVMDWRDLWRVPAPARGWLSIVHPDQRRLRWLHPRLMEAKALGQKLVFTTPDAKKAATEIYGLDESRLAVVPNAFERLGEVPSMPSERRPRLQVVYAGSLSYGRDRLVARLISGMALLRERGGPEIELVLLGGTTVAIQRAIEAEEMGEYVRHDEWLARAEALRIQQQADALLLLQPTHELTTRVAIPAKLFEYMACRRNILSIANDVANDVIRRHDLGVAATGTDPGDLAQALQALARRVAERPVLPPPPEEYSAEHTAAVYAEILRATVRRDSATPS